MIDRQTQRDAVCNAARAFPATFGLRAFPGLRFRISVPASYVNDAGVVMLYTEVQSGDRWLCFAKGTGPELLIELTK